MVEALLRAGAAVDSANFAGVTPLIRTAIWGRAAAAEALLRHGSRMRRPGKDQQRVREDLRSTLPGGAASQQGGCASTMMLEQDREIVSFFLWGDRRITFTFSGCVGPARLKALVLKATGLCRVPQHTATPRDERQDETCTCNAVKS